MDALQGVFGPWGPYSLTALGAAMVGFGFLSGLLLVRREDRPYVRPFFVSAFVLSLLCFAGAAVERQLLAEPSGALVKALLLLIVIGHGLALVHRARTRGLANRSFPTVIVISVVCAVLPVVPGLIGSVVNREHMIAAALRSEAAVSAEILRQASVAIWTPLVAAAIGASFLGLSLIILVVRRARKG